MILWKIAIRNVFRHRARSFITLSAIVFGCTSIILVGGFFDNLFHNLRDGVINTLGHFQVYRQGFSQFGRRDPFKYMIDDPEPLIAQIARFPHVVSVQPQIGFTGLLSAGEATTTFLGQGVDPDYYRYEDLAETYRDVRKYIRAHWKDHLTHSILFIDRGAGLAKTDHYEGLLGTGLAESIDAHVGDTLVAVTNSSKGSLNAIDIHVKGLSTCSIQDIDNLTVQIPLRTAQELLQTRAVQTLLVRLDNTDNTRQIAAAILQKLSQNGQRLEIKTWEELDDFCGKTVAMFHKFFLVLYGIVAIIVVLSIFNTMSMAVMERTNEIGTVMALGSTPAEVLKLFVLEGLVLGLVGGAVGISVGCAITKVIGWIGILMPPPPGSNNGWLSKPSLVPGIILYAYLMAVITSLISSALPAYRASRLDPAEALRKTS